MPFFSSCVDRALLILPLLAVGISAQQCFYPDGTPSNDTACSGGSGSSCCASDAYCLDNGLCIAGGLVTRASCTDKTWGSSACSGFCKEENRNGSIALTPCATAQGASTFVCGLSNGRCNNDENTFVLASSTLVLRPWQVSAIIDPILNSAIANQRSTNTTAPAGYYTSGQLAGLGIGLSLPLALVTMYAFFLWNKHRPRAQKLMYPLPDDDDHNLRDWKSPISAPPAYAMRTAAAATTPVPATRNGSSGSDLTSFRTITPNPTTDRHAPPHVQSLTERYQAMNSNVDSQKLAVAIPARSPPTSEAREFTHELDGQPVGSAFKFGLGPSQRAAKTTSKKSPSPRQQSFGNKF